MTCSDARHRALCIGAAARGELAGGAALCVHSVFAATVNLMAGPARRLVALGGPGAGGLPHAVALERPGDFRLWGLAPGEPARLAGDGLRLRGRERAFVVALDGARLLPRRSLPALGPPTPAWRACAARLSAIQAANGFDLRLDALLGRELPVSATGAGLRAGARALAAAARAGTGRPGLRAAVAGLVGLGAGLTPAGDDFLGGFLAAVRARGHAGLLAELGAAVEERLGATGDISAGLLRWMLMDHWPGPLLELAGALDGPEPGALRALDALCRLGHSSGADLAGGFLFGLENLTLVDG